MSLPLLRFAMLVLLLLVPLRVLAEGGYLCDTVTPSPDYPGKLPAGAVCLRSLAPHTKPDDPHNTLQAIRDFHVTRLEWTYGLTKEFVQQAGGLGCSVGGAANNMTLTGLDRTAPDWYLAVSALDLRGQAVEAPWMRPWPGHALWHCVNNPTARAAYLQYVKDLIDTGVVAIQRDDPSMNINAVNWGGCFCRYCLEGFRGYLQQHGDAGRLRECGVTDPATFDYAEYLRARGAPVGDAFRQYPRDYLKGLFVQFQEESTLAFHRWWRQEANAYAGRPVVVTANNGVTSLTPLYLLFDGFIGELNYNEAEPEALHEAAAACRRLGKGLTTTMPLLPQREETPQWRRRVRQTIAMAYALGIHIEAPWDTYLPLAEEKPARYFGRPEDYADLFGLVRACPGLLDGYEEAATVGLSPGEAMAGPVSVWPRQGRVCAVVRAVPARREAPLVVHLIDYSETPAPATISLEGGRLFGGQPLRLTLLTPRPYDAAAHAAAQESGDFSPLVERRVLGEGAVSTLTLPALRPWGLLTIEPLPGQATLWPPSFASDEEARVVLRGPAGATVRYTIDGGEPDERAAQYAGPLAVPPGAVVRARAFAGGRRSAVSALPTATAGLPAAERLLRNGDFLEDLSGWKLVNALADRQALTGQVVPRSPLGEQPAAELRVNAADGVPYHLRLVQPLTVAAGARVRLRAVLAADRPAHVRLGLQEAAAPYRTIVMREFDLDTRPLSVSLGAVNPHPDLQAQWQLDLGSVQPPTTVWLSGAQVLSWRE